MKALRKLVFALAGFVAVAVSAATPYTDTVMLKKANIKNDLLSDYLKNQLIPIVTKAVTEPIGIMLDIKSANDSISTIVSITFSGFCPENDSKNTPEFFIENDKIIIYCKVEGNMSFIEDTGFRQLVPIKSVDDEFSYITLSLSDKSIKLVDLWLASGELRSVPENKFEPCVKDSLTNRFKGKPMFQ